MVTLCQYMSVCFHKSQHKDSKIMSNAQPAFRACIRGNEAFGIGYYSGSCNQIHGCVYGTHAAKREGTSCREQFGMAKATHLHWKLFQAATGPWDEGIQNVITRE